MNCILLIGGRKSLRNKPHTIYNISDVSLISYITSRQQLTALLRTRWIWQPAYQPRDPVLAQAGVRVQLQSGPHSLRRREVAI